MKITGLVKNSLIDYPGSIAAVIFTYGCNFRCCFCHNPDIVTGKVSNLKIISEEEIFNFLEKRKGLLDGVVITGGEPLINKDMPEFCEKIKKMGYLIKMDSNGTNPEMLKNLIDKKLIDFIAMDIKNSEGRYEETVGVKTQAEKLRESIKIIMDSGLPYEFRSTVLPRLHTKKDFCAMGETIKGAKLFTVQGFRSEITLDHEYRKENSFTFEELEKIKKIFEKYVDIVEVRDNI